MVVTATPVDFAVEGLFSVAEGTLVEHDGGGLELLWNEGWRHGTGKECELER